MDRDGKISDLVWDWMDSVDMDTLHEYAADQMYKYYDTLSDDDIDDLFEELLENA